MSLTLTSSSRSDDRNQGMPPAHGRCTLVGAGPGDPELLTIKALKAIQSATVLLVDDLVSDEIVAMAQPGARVIHVGKRGGCKSTPQSFIERLMIMAVREGEHVVRLKGGDPFIFGRGGEEVEHLAQAGIHVEVVNGITSGPCRADLARRAADAPRPCTGRRLHHRAMPSPVRRAPTGKRWPPPRMPRG